MKRKKEKNALNYDHFWNLTAGTRDRRLLRCGMSFCSKYQCTYETCAPLMQSNCVSVFLMLWNSGDFL